jgi:catechol 2,3-dioxygenase-like lactoylglutathione lyase family enzyme
MEPRLSFVTLGVTDLTRAARFYEEVLRLPRVNDSPEVVFFELGKTRKNRWGQVLKYQEK